LDFRPSGAQPASSSLDDEVPLDLRSDSQGEQECFGGDVHGCPQVLTVGGVSVSALGDHVIDFAQ
jgi:hypothetical protein